MDASSWQTSSQRGQIHVELFEAAEGHSATEAEQGYANIKLLPLQL